MSDRKLLDTFRAQIRFPICVPRPSPRHFHLYRNLHCPASATYILARKPYFYQIFDQNAQLFVNMRMNSKFDIDFISSYEMEEIYEVIFHLTSWHSIWSRKSSIRFLFQ